MGIATDIIILVLTAFFCGLVMQWLHQPLILGIFLPVLFSARIPAA